MSYMIVYDYFYYLLLSVAYWVNFARRQSDFGVLVCDRHWSRYFQLLPGYVL